MTPKRGWSEWAARWGSKAAHLKEIGLWRQLGAFPEAPFTHNDYLDLRRHPQVVGAVQNALLAGVPTTSSGSRVLSGNWPGFGRWETEFAQSAGFPSGLVIGSAAEANRILIGALVGRQDTVIHDVLAHASLVDGAVQSGATRRKFRHNDPEDLRAQLKASAPGGVRLVVTESIFSMDGDIAPLAAILEVCKEEGALLVVDEVHATGWVGRSCTGFSESLPKDDVLVATVHGCGKALASSGGLICTRAEVIEAIINTSRGFLFTTAPSPLAVVAAEAAWQTAKAEPERIERLAQLCEFFSNGLKEHGWSLPDRTFQTPIFPLIAGAGAFALAKMLQDNGYPMRSIRPPTVPVGTERIRITLSADRTPAELQQLLALLAYPVGE